VGFKSTRESETLGKLSALRLEAKVQRELNINTMHSKDELQRQSIYAFASSTTHNTISMNKFPLDTLGSDFPPIGSFDGKHFDGISWQAFR